MNKAKIISAIDIGSSKIVTLVAQINDEGVHAEQLKINIIGVSSVESKGVKKDQIVDIESAVECVVESIEGAERMAGYNIGNVYVSVGGAHITSQNSSGVVAVSNPDSEITEDDVDRVIEAARAVSLPTSREIVHVLPRGYTVDGEAGVRDPIGMSGVRLEVDTHLVSASSPAIKNLTKTINEVGAQVEEMVYSGFASGMACLTDTEKELGCVLVDIGGGTTSVAAYTDSSLSFSGAIPIGAKNVTNDLAIGLRVSLESAEKIKLKLSRDEMKRGGDDKQQKQIEISEEGSSEIKKVQRRTLTEGIIKPRLNELFTMVKLDLERAGLINRIPSGVVLTGGGAMTVGAGEAAKRILSLPVRVAAPVGVGGLIDDISDPRYATVIGLILYGANTSGSVFTSTSGGGGKIKAPLKATFTKLVEKITSFLP